MRAEKYVICCDFASMKCSHFEFAGKLSMFTTDFSNINNYTWIIEVGEMDLIPFSDNMCEAIYVLLSEFLEKDSFFMVFKVSESFSSDSTHLMA